MQSRAEYSWITNQTCTTFRQQFKRFSDECQLPARYLNRVQNVHQLMQQHMIEVSCKMIRLPYQWTAWQIISYRQQSSLQLGNVGRLWRVSLIAFQHRAPHMVIHWIQIWRIWYPFIFSNEIRAILLDPILCRSCCVSWGSVLLKDEVVWQEMSAVFDQIWQELGGEE